MKRSMGFRCSRRMVRSWYLRPIATRKNKATQTCSLPIGWIRSFPPQRRKGAKLNTMLLCAFATLRERKSCYMKIRRFTTLIAALLFTSLVAIGQQAQLEPSAARLQKDVSYLASDALEGRRTGTAGANDAARYIAREFSRLGLRPTNANANGARYLQRFPYVAGVQLGKGNTFAFGPYPRTNDTSLQPSVDWLPLGF